MKMAVSIPDEVYQGTEKLARRTKRSRSRIFNDALREYLARHSGDEVTAAVTRPIPRSMIWKTRWPYRLAASSLNGANGDLARRDLLGRAVSCKAIGAGVSQAGFGR
jgi:hypothetical protein